MFGISLGTILKGILIVTVIASIAGAGLYIRHIISQNSSLTTSLATTTETLKNQKIETEVANGNVQTLASEYDDLAAAQKASQRAEHRARLRAAESSRAVAALLNSMGNSGNFDAYNLRLRKALERVQGAEFESGGEASDASGSPGDGAGYTPFACVDKESAQAVMDNFSRVADFMERVYQHQLPPAASYP